MKVQNKNIKYKSIKTLNISKLMFKLKIFGNKYF